MSHEVLERPGRHDIMRIVEDRTVMGQKQLEASSELKARRAHCSRSSQDKAEATEGQQRAEGEASSLQ